MNDLSSKSIMVVDRGLFLPFAQRLARDFGKVYYHVLNESPFPTPNTAVLGEGFPGIECAREMYGLSVDAYAFPDVGMSSLQSDLRRQGFNVWGSGEASKLELLRKYFKEVQESLGMEVPPYESVVGLKKLRHLLENMEEAYVKISTYRGLAETFHHSDISATNLWMDHLAMLLGPLQEHFPFIVEEPIEAIVETGLDTYCVKGEYPNVAIQGIEAKDKAYIGTVTPMDEMPKELTDIAVQISPKLQEYANFISTEIRITKDGTAYLTDPSCRHATPAGECVIELIDNLSDVVWEGSQGNFIEPEYSQKFAMQVIVNHPEDPKSLWRSARLPKELDRWFKPYAACLIDEVTYWPPLPWSFEAVGNLVSTGDSLEECLDSLKERASLLEAAGLGASTTAIADVLKSIADEQAAGVPFTEQNVPEPVEAIPN
jgi:hypothetical protein